jgi:hypothetical protein
LTIRRYVALAALAASGLAARTESHRLHPALKLSAIRSALSALRAASIGHAKLMRAYRRARLNGGRRNAWTGLVEFSPDFRLMRALFYVIASRFKLACC